MDGRDGAQRPGTTRTPHRPGRDPPRPSADTLRTLPVRHPVIVLALALLLTAGGILGATRIDAQVDFTQFVPEHEGLGPYRTMLQELDGVRFSAIYMAHDAASGTPHLRDEAAFDALVFEQQALTEHLWATFPGALSHQLSVYEAMRAGNYMLYKTATAGNPDPDAYALPEDPVTWDQVRQRILDGDGDDVLAADGASALMLVFFHTDDDLEARRLAGEVDAAVKGWGRDRPGDHPVTEEHQTSGLYYASHYTDELNRTETVRWAWVAAAGAAVALLWVVRRPENAFFAAAGLACALAWTYGILGLAGYRLTLLSLFLAPLVIGIGVDYAVHILHRHEEERARGRPQRDAMAAALAGTGGAVAVAAVTTIAGLLVLLLVPARTFAETGAIAALGLLLGFVAAMTVTPALRTLWPDRRRRGRPAAQGPGPDVGRPDIRDHVGAALGGWATRVRGRRGAVLGGVLLVTLLAATIAWAGTTVESGSTENEFPQDDPVILLQHRIEAEYGAFQRAYLIVQGDITDPDVLRAMHDATKEAAALPLHRSASAVTALLIADDKTDEGSADILQSTLLGAAGQSPDDRDRLPATRAEAKERLDRLFSDPLWRTLAPFTVSADYDLAVVAIQIDPWPDQDALRQLRDALHVQADALQDAVGPDHTVHAAGAPVNRAAVVDQTGPDVAIAALGSAAAVFAVLAVAWSRRGGHGVAMAAGGAGVVLVAALWLLATVPVLDAFYAWSHDAWGAAANRATLSDMFLLAFAITVAAGVDDWVHIVHRYWEARDAGADADAAIATSFRHAGRAITGTTLTTAVAFGLLAGVYFLQSKNLAILTAAGVVYAYLLTLLLAPLVLAGRRPARMR